MESETRMNAALWSLFFLGLMESGFFGGIMFVMSSYGFLPSTCFGTFMMLLSVTYTFTVYKVFKMIIPPEEIKQLLNVSKN